MSLTPRAYTVVIDAPEIPYDVSPESALVDLFEPSVVQASAKLRPSEAGELLDELIPSAVLPVAVRAELPPGTAADVVDAEAVVRAGAAEGSRVLEASLSPGKYEVRLWQSGRIVHTATAVVAPGEPLSLDMRAVPEDPLRTALRGVTSGGSVFLPSESLGPIHDQRLSLWIAILAAKAVTGERRSLFRGLALPEPDAEESPVMVVLAASGPAPSRVRLWTLGGATPVELRAADRVPGFYFGSAKVPVGSHVIGWEAGGGRFAMTIAVLRHRVTVVTIVDVPGEPRTAQQLVLVAPSRFAGLPVDQRPTEAVAHTARWLVNGQEAFARGEPLGERGALWVDPLWELLGAYAALRQGECARAREALSALRSRWPELPDVGVLAAQLGEGVRPVAGVRSAGVESPGAESAGV
ncbi:MAG: hypothetical protein R3F14_42755, partial [Polyangiaceae bacterium]